MEQIINIEKVRAFLAKQQPQIHPFEGHQIEQCEEYVKNLYIDLLCVFAQYENQGTDTAIHFIQRIMAGTGMATPVVEHIKNAMELTVERFDEFLRQCEENKLCNCFVLDAMLIICAAGAPGKKQMEFLAEVAEALKLEKSSLTWLSKLARVILEQNQDAYYALNQEMPEHFRTPIIPCAICYLKEFVSGVLVDTEELLFLYAKERTAFDFFPYFGDSCIFTNRNIIIENLIIESEEIWTLIFENSENVVLNNCSFTNYQFEFWATGNVLLTNCEFGLRRKRVSSLICMDDGSKNLTVDGCYFHNVTTNDYRHYALIISKDGIECTFKNSKFENIEKEDNYSGNRTTIFLSEKSGGTNINLINCQFISCTGDVLFNNSCIKENKDCEFRNCAPLNG